MKYSTKLFLSIMLLLAAAVSLGGNLLMYSSFSIAREQELAAAEQSYKLVQYTAMAAGVESGVLQMDHVVNVLEQMQLDNTAALRLRQYDINIYSRDTKNAKFLDSLDESVSENTLAMQIFVGQDDEHYVQITGMLSGEEADAAKLDGIFQIENAYATLHIQQKLYVQIFVITMLVGLIVALFLQHFLTKPLKNLSAAARQIANGDRSVRADENGKDEFALLASDFNHMTDQLMEEMRRQKNFTGAFAHEMKTPMTSIIGYADLLRSRNLDEETRYQAANYIFKESRRLESLSFKLLDLLVLQRTDFPLVAGDISEFVIGIVHEQEEALSGAGIELRYTVQQGIWKIEPNLLKTLVLNLIDNARKAMPNGGQIRIRQSMESDGFTIAVIDNGIGIPREELSKLTEAFYRVDKSRSRAQGGAGLGLAICAEIAELHGGELIFESTPGKGTCVSLAVKGERE